MRCFSVGSHMVDWAELPESDYLSCSIGSALAGQIGVFGYKPSVLMDMLAGKRAEVVTEVLAYIRTFHGDSFSNDLKTALEPIRVKDLQKVDPKRGGIPKPSKPVMNFNRDELKGLPFKFPEKIVREVVYRQMLEVQCFIQMTFPIELKAPNVMEDIQFIGFISNLLETKIARVLQCNHGEIHSVNVSAYLGCSRLSRTDALRGEIAIKLSCAPDSPWRLVDLSLKEIVRLQEEGPSEEDVSTMLESEEKAHEMALKENGYWLEQIMRGYLSRSYTGDLHASLKDQDEWRNTVRSSLTRLTTESALRRILPSPCTKQYTAVVLMPKQPIFQRFKSSLFGAGKRSSMEEK
ncbi:hypothetical protein KI387_014783, partial [Taxus chinensis]